MTKSARVVEVYLDTPGLALDKPFDYYVPAHIEQTIAVGQRVFVSFNRQYKAGIIWRVRGVETLPDNVKPILNQIDTAPVLTNELLVLATWLCNRYACTMNEAIGAILPGAFRVRGEAYLNVPPTSNVPDDVRATEVWRVVEAENPSMELLQGRFGKRIKSQLNAWLERGYILEEVRVKEEVKAAQARFLEARLDADALLALAAQKERRAPRQAALLRMLAEQSSLEWQTAEIARTTVEALVKDEAIEVVVREKSRLAWAAVPVVDPPVLTRWQAHALEQIGLALAVGSRQTLILHGVTGSGKTEVYIRAIEQALIADKGAIVLVPEIALTPQMVGRFYARFGERIAVLHSGLSKGERRDEWSRILRGEANIVVGARSAVFAPIHNLGLLIVDEEHEPSYKQEEAPHYDARDVAIERAAAAQAVAILGSATPSLTALHLVETGKAKIISLPVRANGRPLPQVEVIDMREELKAGNHSLFSDRLAEEIEATIAVKQQIILFLNRRGYAAAMLCRACGERMRCPHCDISLTVHRTGTMTTLVCHYCGHHQPHQPNCPACGEPAMRAFGMGTEQIEDALRKAWPKLRVLRMDVDTTRKKGSLKQMVDAFEAREADVLIGTQMIAKGLDFPHVRLVGVIAADTMLAVPDYRAHERTFQLLTQVAGRAGRAKTDGLTIIQTYRPDHVAVMAAARHDFETFYREERTGRALFRYPPFCELAVFVASHTDERLARGAAMRFERELRRFEGDAELVILPASPSGIRRIEDKFRYQVVLKYERWDAVQFAVVEAFRLVKLRMNQYGGACRLDVNAQRIG
ncbi:primosomal protein N' [Alicyclobacillus fodiniaquatilis]|uniref:Replication restart protein PriA n=1 Tax=Alicyclobacillus fodiniaquatilis TaxID=1661150 RepID=A0ABW4JQ45_9BACL